MPYQWVLPPPLPESIAKRFPRACPALLQVLYSRQVLGEDSEAGARLREFLEVQSPDPDPFLLLDMDRAVPRILDEIRRGSPIGVFGHYDCDGVTATVLLSEALRRLGATVIPHIPSRSDDYGIPLNGVERLASHGVRLIVTVDCGIKAIPEVAAAAAMGIDVIITDHHQCERQDGLSPDGDLLPAAIAVVNPRRSSCPYPFKSLAGVGVAFRLSQALSHAHPDRLPAEALEGLLDLVCVGTIADVVDLVGENRCLVARGLRTLRELKRPGLRSLTVSAGIAQDKLSARLVAFVLAPRLNAAARLEHGKLSLDLLCAPTCQDAAPLAQRLESLNQRRRQLTEEAVEHACLALGDRADSSHVLVAAGGWTSGISGLVASQLKERFGRPALAISDPVGQPIRSDAGGQEEDACCVGSARSIAGLDITRALSAVRQHLVRYGGHSGAAGFSIRRSAIADLDRDLNDYAGGLIAPEMLGPRLVVDGELALSDLTPDFRSQLDRFEPCGQGNPAPLFLLKGALPLPGSLRCFGQRYTFRIQGPCGPLKATAPASSQIAACRGPLDLVCQLSPDKDYANRLRISALDLRPSGSTASGSTASGSTASGSTASGSAASRSAVPAPEAAAGAPAAWNA